MKFIGSLKPGSLW